MLTTTNNLFLIVPASERHNAIVENLYVLIAAGEQIGAHTLCPVFIGGNEHGWSGVLKWHEAYLRACSWPLLSQYARKSFFSTEVSGPRRIACQYSSGSTDWVLSAVPKAYCEAWKWMSSIRVNKFLDSEGSSDIIMLADPSSPVDLSLSTIMAGESTNITIIYTRAREELNASQQAQMEHAIEAAERNGAHTVTMPDTRRTLFTALIAAITVVDASRRIVDGEATFDGNGVKEFYQHYDLSHIPMVSTRQALMRFAVLASLIRGSYEKQLNEWKKRIDFANSAPKLFVQNNMTAFLSLFDSWHSKIEQHFMLTVCENANVFDFGCLRLDMTPFLQRLNRIRQTNTALSILQQKQRAVDTIIEAACSTSPENVTDPPQYRKSHPETEQHIDNWQQWPSPLALFDYCRDAFGREATQHTKNIRSSILDLWEVFFRLKKDELNKFFAVEEIDTRGNMNEIDSPACALKNIVPGGFIFIIRDRQTRQTLAVTSPYTGFAVCSQFKNPVIVDGHTMFSDNCRELKERDTDFRIFLTRYTDAMPVFAPTFQEYIENSLSKEELRQARSLQFFSAYPDYRSHLPVT